MLGGPALQVTLKQQVGCSKQLDLWGICRPCWLISSLFSVLVSVSMCIFLMHSTRLFSHYFPAGWVISLSHYQDEDQQIIRPKGALSLMRAAEHQYKRVRKPDWGNNFNYQSCICIFILYFHVNIFSYSVPKGSFQSLDTSSCPFNTICSQVWAGTGCTVCQVLPLCSHHLQTTHTLTGGRACWQSLCRTDTFSATVRQLKNIYRNKIYRKFYKTDKCWMGIWYFKVNSKHVSGRWWRWLPTIHLPQQQWLWLKQLFSTLSWQGYTGLVTFTAAYRCERLAV